MSRFRRRLMMGSLTQNSGPYDAEVKYLETDGLAFINTGVGLVSNLRFEVDYDAASGSGERYIYGASNGWNNEVSLLINYSSTGNIALHYANRFVTLQLGFAGGRLLSISDNNNLRVNGVKGLTSSAWFSYPNIKCTLFASNRQGQGGITARKAGDKIISAKIYDGNGTLIRYYIPVRKRGVGYLYDTVTGELYGNAHTSGAFRYGEDVPYTARVQYLESTGAQGVDTGVNFSKQYYTRLDLQWTKPSSQYNMVFGAYYDDTTAPRVQLYATNANKWAIGGFTTQNDFEYSNTYGVNCPANGDSLTSSRLILNARNNTTDNTGVPMYLFARNNDRNNYLFADGLRIYDAQMAENIALGHLIPVRVGEIGCLYDTISGQLCNNVGYSPFVVGADV